MRSGQTTITDIAKQLNISATTVSRALKDHPDIGANTKKAVKDLALLLGYRPNAVALSLRFSRSYIIGLIVPEIVHEFFSTVIHGIEEVTYEAGYNVMVCQSNESVEREIKNTNTLLLSRVDGIIVSLSKETSDFEHFKNLQKNEIPLVFFDRICEELETDCVVIDDYAGAFQMVEHLIDAGCRNIVHMKGPQNLLIGKNRLKGYIDALKKHNLEIDERYIVDCDTFDKALKTTPDLLKLVPRPDGIFAVNDVTAIGAMKVIKQHNLQIPDDIAVAGFTNRMVSSLVEPQLSTVEQQGFEMGRAAAKLLLQRINSKTDNKTSVTQILQPQLIIRESSNKKHIFQKNKELSFNHSY